MKLEEILEPVSNSMLAEASRQLPATIGRQILPIIPGLTRIDDAEVLLLGVYANEPNSDWSPNEVRACFYKLFAPHGMKRVADLGNISSSLCASEQDNALEFISDLCAAQKKTLVLFSPDQNNTYPLFKGIQNQRNDTGVAVIDNTLDMGAIIGENPAPKYLSKIMEDTSNEPMFMSVIGIQNYLTNPLDIEISNKMYLEILRLGELRSDLKGAEPMLRDANVVSFDMSAIRFSDNPDCKSAGPNGLYAEEACLLSRYAGFADKVDIFALFGDFGINTSQKISSQLAAQLIWHFLDGYANRKREYPLVNTKKTQKFIVKLGKDDEELIFYKSKITDRWWMEIYSNKNKKNAHTISCRYDDYQEASRQEVPYRWLWYYKKWN